MYNNYYFRLSLHLIHLNASIKAIHILKKLNLTNLNFGNKYTTTCIMKY